MKTKTENRIINVFGAVATPCSLILVKLFFVIGNVTAWARQFSAWLHLIQDNVIRGIEFPLLLRQQFRNMFQWQLAYLGQQLFVDVLFHVIVDWFSGYVFVRCVVARRVLCVIIWIVVVAVIRTVGWIIAGAATSAAANADAKCVATADATAIQVHRLQIHGTGLVAGRRRLCGIVLAGRIRTGHGRRWMRVRLLEQRRRVCGRIEWIVRCIVRCLRIVSQWRQCVTVVRIEWWTAHWKESNKLENGVDVGGWVGFTLLLLQQTNLRILFGQFTFQYFQMRLQIADLPLRRMHFLQIPQFILLCFGNESVFVLILIDARHFGSILTHRMLLQLALFAFESVANGKIDSVSPNKWHRESTYRMIWWFLSAICHLVSLLVLLPLRFGSLANSFS